MSAAAEEKKSDYDTLMLCAGCGVAGGDDIKLKKCTACYLVKYCSVKCQKDHWSKHKKACKKRVAELHDEILFKQPESNHFGDCPICCLPLPLDPSRSSLMTCCSKIICNGCEVANKKREDEGNLQHNCPFCRQPEPNSEEEINEEVMKRIEANFPAPMRLMGTKRYLEGDYNAAFDYWSKAAALGDVPSHFELSCLYRNGEGVQKDKKKELHHAEQAAIGGHPDARHNLGFDEWKNGRMDRAAKHWIIAAKLGLDQSFKCVRGLYRKGHVSEEDFAAALHGLNAAIDATESPQREEAALIFGPNPHLL